MRKHTIIYCFIFLLSTTILPAQTVVVTDDSTYVSGQASAVLDLKSTTKGFLPPRVTAAQKDAISSPATGLMVYQTDGIAGYYLWTGTVWDLLVSGLGGVNPVSKTASTTLTQTETFVLASNNITLTLPVVTSAENGLSITVKNIGTVTDLVQVDGNGTATIDGSIGVSNHTRWQAKTYVAHEGNWVLTAAADAGTLSSTMLAGNVVSSSLTSLGTLTGLTVTNPIAGSITGNAATATALQTSRAINGVNFNGTTDITVTAAAATLTGTTLASNVTESSLTSVGTLTGLTVSSAINGSVTGSAATVTAASQPAITSVGTLTGLTVSSTINGSVTGSAATVTGASQPAITSVGTLTGLTVSSTINGSITGNAATATALQTSRAINGVNFNGTTDITITVTAAAETLTGTTLASNVTGSSLTSVGTLTGLTVSSAINGSVTGSAATVTAASQPNITTLGSLVSISTITTGVWNGTTIAAANGGTGVANSNTITLGGNINTAGAVSTVGANSLTLTTTGATNVTLPTSGTLGTVLNLLQLSADVNLSSTTLTNVTGLNTFALDAGSTYYFRFICLVQSNAGIVGILLSLNASAAVASINFVTKWPTSATASSYGNFTALQGGTLPTTGPGAVSVEYLLEGTVVTTGAVTFSLQQRSETATQTTVKAGSLGIVQKL
ncbi:MAG: hypothetical protein Q8R50_12590 [Sediminibacterium sp.]|nr:hypothetical protein [Sediminibacterium sp.]